jgi:hypothetical protein
MRCSLLPFVTSLRPFLRIKLSPSSRRQRMRGAGWPAAWHTRVAFSPSCTVMSELVSSSVMSGGTEIHVHFMNIKVEWNTILVIVGDVIHLLPSCGLRKSVQHLAQRLYFQKIRKPCSVRQSQFVSFLLNTDSRSSNIFPFSRKQKYAQRTQ